MENPDSSELQNRVKTAINKSKKLINKFKSDKWFIFLLFEVKLQRLNLQIICSSMSIFPTSINKAILKRKVKAFLFDKVTIVQLYLFCESWEILNIEKNRSSKNIPFLKD